MKSEGQDRRIKRTQRLLAEALIALTLERGYETVTIRELTERADIGYATFFRHYADKDALLEDVLDVVLDELLVLLQQPQALETSMALGTVLFRYVASHSAVCRVLLRSRHATVLMQKMIEAGTSNMLAGQTPLPGSPVPPEIAAHHVVTASIALIAWWLEHEMPYSAEQMAMIYHELIVRPTHEIAFSPEASAVSSDQT